MSLNKVILIGNVGKDPDVRYFDNNQAVANFSLATTDRGYTLANGTVVPDRTEWHNIVVFRERVSFVEKYVKKGSLVYVEGKIRSRSYDDASGIKRYVTEIYADRVEFYNIGGRSESTTAATTPNVQQSAPQPTNQQPPSTSIQQMEPAQNKSSFDNNEADDLPF